MTLYEFFDPPFIANGVFGRFNLAGVGMTCRRSRRRLIQEWIHVFRVRCARTRDIGEPVARFTRSGVMTRLRYNLAHS